MSILWQKHRTKPFDDVPVEVKYKKVTYLENQLLWKGNYVSITHLISCINTI